MPQFGELIMLVSPKGKRYLFRLEQDKTMHTQDGVIATGDIAETQFGGQVRTHMGKPYRLIRPILHDLIKGVKRQTPDHLPKGNRVHLPKTGHRPGLPGHRGGQRLGRFDRGPVLVRRGNRHGVYL